MNSYLTGGNIVSVTSTSNFVQAIIDEDIANGAKEIYTRFPPEPNGYLHVGHAKSICLNFGLAERNNGKCNLRFDDTNPVKEDTEYVDSIKQDVEWLGFRWEGEERYASDYFPKFYECAVQLIKDGKAFVCDLNAEEMREYRGTLTEPGKESPYRNRSVEENLALFEAMKNGEFADGAKVLRAKIDMASPNINMRDPIIYRIAHAHHHRTGDAWCIYPMYDFAHPISDAIEGISHSVCTLEFEDHRPLYDWVLDNLAEFAQFPSRPHQYEFARLELNNTITSKRKLKKLVDEGIVDGWDDPRMPTISGMRRRGYTPEAIRNFCDMIGVSKSNSRVEFGMLEYCLREDLNMTARRAMVVLDPLKITITNYPEGQIEYLDAEINPNQPELGTYKIPFGREIYIEQEDFKEEANNKFFRLKPGKEVRLKHAYIIQCDEVVKDEAGNIIELKCTYDPTTRSGMENANRKVKGTLHWVEATTALDAEVHMLDFLLLPEQGEGDFMEYLNPNSLVVKQGCKATPDMKEAKAGDKFQFLRNGYFCVDSRYSTPDHLVFNETVSLKGNYKPE
ncbi:MAG: glutamine--tRNA ligase/YqeY domain fusion protein [Peptococcaceae bacterium]|jgi:glutaminyl-tRNA synthetase|nr:glutamine--tRNA ligase/YqeY domain fusion protein [Peptococcaceae bacterium]MBQ5706901.1 glutamine--tRNA ligase/YqeY domain fusion protein [Peptococcaceae bacterium]